MWGNLIDTIRQDVKQILTNTADFGQAITLTAPTSPLTTLDLVGTVKKHHTVYDEIGNPTRAKGNTINATITVSPLTLDDADYPYRTAEGRVSFKGHRVSWTDVSGTYVYMVNEWYPDEVTGNISLELGYYNG